MGSQKCKTDLEGTFQAKGVNTQPVSCKRERKKAESLRGTGEETEQQTPSACRSCKTEVRLAKTQAELQLAILFCFLIKKSLGHTEKKSKQDG